jgi:hypothetical protein
MKSHKEPSRLIVPNNSVTYADSLSIIDIRRSMEHMKIKGLVDALFFQIGLSRNEKYKMIDLIKSAKSRNIEIVSVCNIMFPSHFNPDIRDIATTDFKKKFFGSVLYGKRQDGDSFIEIMKILDDEYVLTTIDAKTVSSVSDPRMILYVRGNRVDEDNTVGNNQEIIMTLSFTN